jgi:DNA sulfur modification protein DndB
MKIPAIRAHIGDWTYYVSTLTFQEVSDHVSKIDQELHKSENLRELIQRSITSNYLSIKDYILNQKELFFNSLVLAVYDDYPEWKEIELTYDNNETYMVGLLDFPNKHKIFPVDGQHRVEGIKAALLKNPNLADSRVSVIFIGHKNTEAGMQRTRRLFSTLNRYAKPVTMDDIIALDEDDLVAITTRNLLENHRLFLGKNVTKSNNKAIPNEDKDSFTSIITLYECNLELLKIYRHNKNIDKYKRSTSEFLKFRPDEDTLSEFQIYVEDFWNIFINVFKLENYIKQTPNKALPYRNNINGGHLLFRPVGLLPFVKAACIIQKRSHKPFELILKRLRSIDYSLNKEPWKQVVWNDFEKRMIMGNQPLTRQLIIYLYKKDLLTQKEINSCNLKYSSALNDEEQNSLEKLSSNK